MIHSAAASSVISPTPEADGCAFKGKLEEHSSALFFWSFFLNKKSVGFNKKVIVCLDFVSSGHIQAGTPTSAVTTSLQFIS